MVDDRLAVDGVRERAADPDVAERRVEQVDADVLVVHAGSSRGLEVLVAAELIKNVGRDVVDDEIDRPRAQFQAPHHFVGDDPQDEPFVRRPAGPVVVERGQLDTIVGQMPHELVRTRANRVGREVGPGASRDDLRDHQIGRERRERFRQREHDGERIARLDRLQAPKGARDAASARPDRESS